MSAADLRADGELGPRTKAFIARVQSSRVPACGSIELTHRCNLACTHCYVNLPAADRGAQVREMTTAQVCKLIDELADLGTLSLTLTGGEPLLRPDFPEIYRHAHQKGIMVVVYSNATLITSKIIDLFTEMPPKKVDITQYGYTAETYDKVTDAGDGQYWRFRRGLDRLRKAGITVALKTVAIRSNVHEVFEIKKFAEREGLKFRMDPVICPRIDGGKGPLKERLSPAEVAELENRDDKARDQYKQFYDREIGEVPETDALYQCGAGSNFLIDPYGRLHMCELSRRLSFDVLTHGFAKGWFEAVPEQKKRKRPHNEGCGSCSTHAGCSNCVGMAELEGLIPADGNSYFCSVTDERNRVHYGEARPEPRGLIRLRLGKDRGEAQTKGAGLS